MTYSVRGIPRYSLEIWHDGLKKHRLIKGESEYLIKQKARLQLEEWEVRWEVVKAQSASRAQRASEKELREARKAEAMDASSAAEAELKGLQTLLLATLQVDDSINWESLKDHSLFPEPAPKRSRIPEVAQAPHYPSKPQPTDERYNPKIGLFDMLVPGRSRKKREMAQVLLSKDLESYREQVAQADREHAQQLEKHQRVVAKAEEVLRDAMREWEDRRNAFLSAQAAGHAQVEARRQAYLAKDKDAIEDYCELVLSSSSYPDYFPQEFDLEYDEAAKTLIVEYQLPSPDAIPTLKAVRYIASRDELEESHIAEAQKLKLYDDVLYQVALRSIHEIFESDVVRVVESVVFNGIVTATDRTTGKAVTACIMSVRAGKAEFMEINLAQVEPKACFKALKGIGSAKLSGLAAVAPVMQMRREDSRFVAAQAVADSIDAGFNLASMDWQDFEHLIRELFEKEFSSTGGEVKVTQASRDGGVDAVAFDPDPIRGGKIVIQAKRYTNTVTVSAVRDLYGTVMAEGATKGVLVTTSDYGPDAYTFANGKPLVLLNGANLLHMLNKHGHMARIDIREARIAAKNAS